MKRLVRIGIVSLGAAVVLLAAFHYMRAQGELSPNAVQAPHELSPSMTNNQSVAHTLLTTYFTQATNVGTALPGHFPVHVDSPTTFKCPFHEGCTLEIEQSVQLCGGGTNATPNRWGTAVAVDNIAVMDYGPYLGEVPSDGNCVLGTSNQTTPVKHGTHTVFSYAVSDYASTLQMYHVNYRVYCP